MANIKFFEYNGRSFRRSELFSLPECKCDSLRKLRHRLAQGHTVENAMQEHLPFGAKPVRGRKKPTLAMIEAAKYKEKIRLLMAKPPRPETMQYGLLALKFEQRREVQNNEPMEPIRLDL